MHLLFDLDGTLTDSFPGISRSINHTLLELGLESVPDTRLRGFVGAPLASIFRALLASSDPLLLERAISTYCDRFDDVGILENRVFHGIPEALTAFRASGHTLQVVTARSVSSARHVVRHFALEPYFVAVHGPEPTDRACNKADLVSAALAVAGGHASEAVMVGDRADDINAARAHGVRAVAAAWGYGSRAELTAAAPDHVAETVADLVAWVQSAG
jgi:phosphoglycolate phosphatase